VESRKLEESGGIAGRQADSEEVVIDHDAILTIIPVLSVMTEKSGIGYATQCPISPD
jgi:hypothetical protein